MRAAEEIVWPGGEHPFRLDIGALRALQKQCDAGCSVVLMRLIGGTWFVDDIVATLRLGLIGGGMDDKTARLTIERALEGSSLYGLSVPAAEVLKRFIMWEDDDLGEASAGAATTSQTRSPTESSGGQPTSEPVPLSA